MPSTTPKSRRPRTAASVARVTALPLAIAVMAATVALQPSDDAPDGGGSAQSFAAQAVLASADFTLSDASGASDLRHSLVRKSDGSYDLSLWRQGGGNVVASDDVPPVVVTFHEPIQRVQLVNPTAGSQPQTTWSAPRSVTVPVANGLILLKVSPGASPTSTPAPTVVQAAAATVPIAPKAAAATKPRCARCRRR